MPEKINFSDLADLKGAQDYLQVLTGIEQQLKLVIADAAKVPKQDVKGANYAELQKSIATIKQAEQAQVSLEKVEQQRIKTQQELEKAEALKAKTDMANLRLSQEIEKATRKELDAYQLLSKQYNEAAKNAKNLAVVYGENSTQAKNAAKTALDLNEKLKKIDATVGQHQRNVGNYSNSMKDAIRQSGLFSGVLAISDKITAVYNATMQIATTLLMGKKVATEEATIAEATNTTITEENTTAEVINTASKEGNILATEGEVVAEKTAIATTEVDIATTEADTVAQKANTLARLGLVGAIIAVGAVIVGLVKALVLGKESTADAADGALAYANAWKETGSFSVASAAKAHTLALKELTDQQNNLTVSMAKQREEAMKARQEAMETDVLPDKIKGLKEFQDKNKAATDTEIGLLTQKAKIERNLANAYIAANAKGRREQVTIAVNAEAAVYEAEQAYAKMTIRTAKQILAEETEIKKEELKMYQDAAKARIELMKVEEDKKQALNYNSYQDELTALIEEQRKLGDAEGVTGSHASERYALYQTFLDRKAEITKQANIKQKEEMQKLQDDLLSIELKTNEFENDLIHEQKVKKHIEAQVEYDKEIEDIKKKNRELDKQESELYKLTDDKRKEQQALINKERDALGQQAYAAGIAWANKDIDIDVEYAKQVIEINQHIADEELKQEEKLLERKLNLQKKKTEYDTKTGSGTPAGLKQELEDLQKEKDIAHEIELKKEQEFNEEEKDEIEAVSKDRATTEEYKEAKIKEIQQKYSNERINARNAEADEDLDFDKKMNDAKLKADYEAREKALALIDGVEQYYFDKSQRRLDNEIKASQSKQDYLKQMAARNVQDAKNNLAFEEANEIKLQAQKEKQIRRQKEIELGESVLKAYSKNLESSGGDSGKALAATMKDTIILTQFIKSLPGLLEGTEDTGNGGDVDKNKGMLRILHPHERVMTKEQNEMVNGLSNWELANAGLLYKNQIKQTIDEDRFMSSEKVLQKFDELKQVIESKPVYLGNEYHKDTHQLCEMIEQGNSLIKNHKTLSKLG